MNIKVPDIINRSLNAQIINIDFILRHWLIVLTVLIMFLTYIASKYMVLTHMEQSDRLNASLEIVSAERAHVREGYMSRIRESALAGMVDTMGLGLSVSERPPYKIADD